jgi:hypothetical protein
MSVGRQRKGELKFCEERQWPPFDDREPPDEYGMLTFEGGWLTFEGD